MNAIKLKKIRVYCYASHGNKRGMWGYLVEYLKSDGNSSNDIWNSDSDEIDNTTLLQMQFKAILESLWYLNSLTGTLKPDIQNVIIHTSSKYVINLLQKDYAIRNNYINRSKVERVYRDYCKEIWKEMNGWNIEYKIIKPNIPDWLIDQRRWLK
jgi:ribonuclease HI